jgi:hypothetical protein
MGVTNSPGQTAPVVSSTVRAPSSNAMTLPGPCSTMPNRYPIASRLAANRSNEALRMP